MERERRPRPSYPTRRHEAAIMALVRRGLTYPAIARLLADRGVTYDIARGTARRMGIRRPAGRPRASAPSTIPSRSTPPARW
jgi:hypothetical protein